MACIDSTHANDAFTCAVYDKSTGHPNPNKHKSVLTTPAAFEGADDTEGKKAGLTCGTGAPGWAGGGPL